jgi:sugar/nucleoside kinase (ribokinase family)
MIAAPVDLLVIGGLTVDRFADGSTAPGGSVLHIARSAAPRGIRLAVLTVAGPEPETRAGLEELRELVVALEVADADATATFRHHHAAGVRQLRLERRGGRVAIRESPLIAGAEAVLVAPIAGEVVGEELPSLDPVPIHAAILQGWLRSLDEGAGVRPLPMAALGAPLAEALARFDLLVASREDLLAESGDPRAQLRALRRTVGTRPALVVSDGTDGLWLDAQGATRHHPIPRRIDSVATVGAGDILAAFLALRAGDPQADLDAHAGDAMRVVAEILEERRR